MRPLRAETTSSWVALTGSPSCPATTALACLTVSSYQAFLRDSTLSLSTSEPAWTALSRISLDICTTIVWPWRAFLALVLSSLAFAVLSFSLFAAPSALALNSTTYLVSSWAAVWASSVLSATKTLCILSLSPGT